jgi:CBS domain-containing protein
MIQPLRVREFMNTDLQTATPDTEIMSAVRQLVAQGISGLLIVDDSGALVGILTERDCIAVALQAGYFDEAGGRVEQFMTANVDTVDPDANILDLAQMLAKAPYRRYPVVEDGRLIGLICRRDVLRALTTGNWFSAPPNTVK